MDGDQEFQIQFILPACHGTEISEILQIPFVSRMDGGWVEPTRKGKGTKLYKLKDLFPSAPPAPAQLQVCDFGWEGHARHGAERSGAGPM